MIEIYQTLSVTTCFAKAGIESIMLIPERDQRKKLFEVIEPVQSLRINLGPPILKFNISRMTDRRWVNKAMAIIKSWIELDQYNIDQKSIGFTFFLVPENYITNKPLETPKSFIGNFKEASQAPKHEERYYDALFKLLSQLVHQAAAERDSNKFNILSEFCGRFLSTSKLKDSWGLRLLTLAVNAGGKIYGAP